MEYREYFHKIKTLLFGFLWLLAHHRRLSNLLKNTYGITDVIPWKIAHWHRGSRYFVARHQSAGKIFVKLDGHYRLIRNEIAAYSRLQSCHLDSVMSPRLVASDLDGAYPFAAFEWIYGEALQVHIENGTAKTMSDEIGRALVGILENLKMAHIVHRDLTPSNIIVESGQGKKIKLYVIDYAFAIVANNTELQRAIPKHELQALGTGYKPSPLEWDDAFSCKVILNKIERMDDGGIYASFMDKKIGTFIYKINQNC